MDIQRIKRLIDLVAEEDIAELEVDEPGASIRIAREEIQVAAHAEGAGRSSEVGCHFPSTESQGADLSPEGEDVSPQNVVPAAAQRSGTVVRAPMVGIFYRSAKEGGEPLVRVGTVVEAGTPLCVIEAMKIMNEIPSEEAGTVTQVLCESGQQVDSGQPLFVIE